MPQLLVSDSFIKLIRYFVLSVFNETFPITTRLINV